jgi:hypothetical protein
MRKYFLGVFLIISMAFSVLNAQDVSKITGTVGKEKMIDDKLVICELGSKACMFMQVDPNLVVDVNGKKLKPEELEIGWYLEAEVEENENGERIIKALNVEPDKTVICFSSLNEKEGKEVKQMLLNKNGIKLVNLHLNSQQVYIEYDPQVISYLAIEKTITDDGHEIE